MVEQKIVLEMPILLFFLIDLIILVNTRRNRINVKSHRMFMRFVICVLAQQGLASISYASDFALIYIPITINYFLGITCVIFQTAASYYWCRYLLLTVSGEQRDRTVFVNICHRLPVWIIAIAAMISPWTGTLFYFDEAGIYHHGSLFVLQMVCPYSYIVLALVCTIIRLKNSDSDTISKTLRQFTLMIIPSVIGAVMQLTIGRYGYTQIGISMGLIFMYLELYIDEINENKRLKNLEELNHSLENQMTMIQSLSQVYYSSYYIDIDSDSFIELSSKEGIRNVAGATGDARKSLDAVCESIILPKYRDKMHEFFNLDTLNERLANRYFITIEYEGAISGWSQAYFIADKRDENGNVKKAFLATRVIHDEKEREAESNAIIEGLSQEYHTVWIVDKETLQMQLMRSTGVSTIKSALAMHEKYSDYNTAIFKYIETYVEPEDRMRMKKEASSSEILEQLSRSNFYAVNYLRRDDEGHVGYHQIAFINADTKNGKKRFVYGFRDIDKIVKEEQALKEELRDARRAAEEANKSKTIFLNNMSHDIRTPMNAIIGFAELLEREKDNPEVTAEYVAKIKNSGEYLLTIINNVLDMARIESGQTEVDNEFSDLTDETKSAIPLFEDMFKKKNITFTASQDIRHRYIYLDHTKTQQITINLLSNAVKYTPEGGSISLTMREVPCDREGFARYVMEISDTGIGMSSEFKEHIFDYFSRERNTTESKVIGTGLGMPIVKKLVELMGGTIEVESELGRGTTFTVTLEHQIVIDPETYLADNEDEGHEVTPLKNKRILLTEDNDLNAEIATIILEDAGLLVERAEDGVECIKMLNDAQPGYYDAILMDIQMPNLNGYDATLRIRGLEDNEKARIPIIAMTANAFEEDRRHAFEVGMNGHLAKPVNIEKLMETLSKSIH